MRFRFFRPSRPKPERDEAPNTEEAVPKVSVVRTMTMPGGKKIRVMRKDAFDRSIRRDTHPASA